MKNSAVLSFLLGICFALPVYANDVVVLDAAPVSEVRCAQVQERHARALKIWNELARRSEVLSARIAGLEGKPHWVRSLRSIGIRAEMDRINRRIEELKAIETPEATRKDFLQELVWELPAKKWVSAWGPEWSVERVSGELQMVTLVNGAWAWGEAGDILEAAGFEGVESALQTFRESGALRLRRQASLVEICLGRVVFLADAAVQVTGVLKGESRSQQVRVQLRQTVDLKTR
jgi:hypothetical protein